MDSNWAYADFLFSFLISLNNTGCSARDGSFYIIKSDFKNDFFYTQPLFDFF